MEKEIITKTKDFIQSHLKHEFTLDELASFVGYSSYHFAREFKASTGMGVMEFFRNERIKAAADDIANGLPVCETAMEYCFDTHAGFTKAFVSLFGCTPKDFAKHNTKQIQKGTILMENSKIVIRPVCVDDVQDLWENVYSAMTPKQITNDYILPWVEKEKNMTGLHLVAQVDCKVVMALRIEKQSWIPYAFMGDNNFVLTGGDEDIIMEKMLDEVKKQCKMMNVSCVITPQSENSENVKAFLHFGFTKVFTADKWDYLMLDVTR